MQVKELKIQARERFALNIPAMLVYGVAYTIALNIAILTTALCLLSGYAIWYGIILAVIFLLAFCLLGYGMAGFYLSLYRFDKTDGSTIFDGFKKRRNFERILVLRLIQFGLWLVFTILLIVPGILFLLRTSMATYILRMEPQKKPTEALRESNVMMKTHIRKFFVLVISFTGWFLVGLITCGLGFIWVTPYFKAAKVMFYGREVLGDMTDYRKPDNLTSVPVADWKEPALPRNAQKSLLQHETQVCEKVPSTSISDVTQDFSQDEIPILDFPIRDAYEEDADVKPHETVVTEFDTAQDIFADELWKIPYTPATEEICPDEILSGMLQVEAPTEQETQDTSIADSFANRHISTVSRENRLIERQRASERVSSVGSESDSGMRRHESSPLPGGRVVMGAEGHPVMDRRRPDTSDRRAETPRPEAGKREEEQPMSAGERLEKLRAERMAQRAAREAKQQKEHQ